MFKFYKDSIGFDDGSNIDFIIEYDNEFNITKEYIKDEQGDEIKDVELFNTCKEFSLGNNFIKPGEYYEDCRYRPMKCYVNDNGYLEGWDLISNEGGFHCSEDNCGVKKLTLKEVNDLKQLWENGKIEVMMQRGWKFKEAMEYIRIWDNI